MNQELNMAIKVRDNCYEILDTIKRIKSNLGQAKGLGIWDILGGGFFASFLKHSKIDNIQSDLSLLQQQIKHLRDIFNDSSIMRDDIDFEVTDFDVVFDLFLDNIFSDIAVQSKLNQMDDKISALEDKIVELLNELEDRYVFLDED